MEYVAAHRWRSSASDGRASAGAGARAGATAKARATARARAGARIESEGEAEDGIWAVVAFGSSPAGTGEAAASRLVAALV